MDYSYKEIIKNFFKIKLKHDDETISVKNKCPSHLNNSIYSKDDVCIGFSVLWLICKINTHSQKKYAVSDSNYNNMLRYLKEHKLCQNIFHEIQQVDIKWFYSIIKEFNENKDIEKYLQVNYIRKIKNFLKWVIYIYITQIFMALNMIKEKNYLFLSIIF